MNSEYVYNNWEGDFIQVRNPALEVCKYEEKKQKSQLAIDTIEEELGVVDISRLLHPQDREYTF